MQAGSLGPALRPPPRELPLGLFCASSLSWAGAFWAAFLSVWVLYLTLFSSDGRPGEVLKLRLFGKQAPAVITAIRRSPDVLNGQALAHIAYVYKDGGREQAALAYDFESAWQVGDVATAVYVPGSDVRRLRGPGQQPYGLFGWVQWILPFSALILGSAAWRRGLEGWMLLKYGEAAPALVTNVWRRRFKARFRVNYRFEDEEGRPRAWWSDLPADSLPAGQKADVLYVPGQSQISSLVDSLEWRFPLSVDERGGLRYTGGLLPLLRFAAAGALAVLALLAASAHLVGLLPDVGR